MQKQFWAQIMMQLAELRYRATLSPEEVRIRRANQAKMVLSDEEIGDLSAEDLRKKLGDLGYEAGPVTPATRKVLETKLNKLQAQ